MKLIDQILDLAFSDIEAASSRSRDLARLSLFDWIVCGIGGLGEPVSRKVRQFIAEDHGSGRASVFGGSRASAIAAALANGSTSHALDYDDTHFAHIGHLSVGIYPAALAVGQEADASLDQVIDAFLVGAEAAIRVGLALGTGHYQRGFHQTATAGAFGATIAAARLCGLSREECRAALGLCATRASGLKSQFGTMGKPLNAGYAASNGVECTRLAALGMTSADDGLEGQQGFIATHSEQPAAAINQENFLFDQILYKLHACCHGTHAMIEAIMNAQNEHGFAIEDVRQLRVSVPAKWLRVCDIKKPRTGLEVKFSYTWLAGLVLQGKSSADPKLYIDALCEDPQLQAFAENVTVSGVEDIADTAAEVTVDLADGQEISGKHNLTGEVDQDVLSQRLRDKASVVIGNRSEKIWSHITNNSAQPASSLHDLL